MIIHKGFAPGHTCRGPERFTHRGKANKALIDFISKLLEVPSRSVSILKGEVYINFNTLSDVAILKQLKQNPTTAPETFTFYVHKLEWGV